MHTHTVLPFLLLFLIGVAGMGQPVYQICRRGVGTLRIDAHRIPASAWRNAYRATIASWRRILTRLVPLAVAGALLLAITHVLPHADAGVLLAVPAALPSLKSARQAVVDVKAKGAQLLADIKARGGAMTDEEKAQLTAIDANLTEAEAQVVEAERFADLERRLSGSHVTAGRVDLGRDLSADRPWGPEVAAGAPEYAQAEARHIALGNFALAVRAAYSGGGTDPRLMAAATGAGTQTDSNLGFAVPVEIAPGIEREMYTTGDVLSQVDVRTISGNAITYNVIDQTSRVDGSRGGGVLGYWVDEGTAPTASNTKLAKIELKLRKVGAFGVMTDELLSDAAALGGELESAFADELIFQVENKIHRGDGAAGPLGFLNAPCLVTVAKETGQVAATIVNDNLIKMWARVPARSKKNAVWCYNTETLPQLHTLTQAIGTGGVLSRYVNVSPDGSLTIFGRPAIEMEYCSALGTAGDICVCDFAKYRLIRKGGVEQASSMHVYFSTGEQAFRAFYRVDGQPVPRAAVTPFKGSATLSPFVTLATRA